MNNFFLKHCSKCGEYKQSHEFYFLHNRNQYQAYCKQCAGNKNSVVKKKNKQIKRNFVKDLKDNKPCKDCGVCYPYYVMDFDHKPEFEKKLCVNQLTAQRATKEILLNEISKCDLVCSNCHRIRTHERRANGHRKK